MLVRHAALALALLALAGCTAAPDGDRAAAAAEPQPVGHRGGWDLVFRDEFGGTTLDPSRWADRSSAEPDDGRGNLGNQQLEWNRAANCQVAGGELRMTARREQVTSPAGVRYDWTSCLITSTPSYSFRYGYIEERAVLPAARGFWPAFWTWQARGADSDTETDVYEFYSDNRRRLYSSQRSGGGGACAWEPSFDPTAGWHTYGAAITPSGTIWYADGVEVCRTAATADAPTNIISNLAVYARVPPDEATAEATKRVDYVRAWVAR
jgi:beta-glucanase (GH16 family)